MAPSITNLKETPPFHANSPPTIKLENSTFLANNNPILTQVPPNITVTPPPHFSGCFVGFEADEPLNRHVVSIGTLIGIRFTSIFRFKLWWSTHWTGNKGSDIENETQMIILENDIVKERPYVLLLPLIEGSFRASLQPGSNKNNHVDICMESDSTRVIESSFKTCLYIHANFDPYILMNEAIKVVRDHLGTFKLLEEKTVPDIVDKFGWCTWDAFYLKVHPQGVKEGIKGLVEGECPPSFVIIDDGWQNFCRDDEDFFNGGDCLSLNCAIPGEQMLGRLISFEENKKFKEYDQCLGMGGFVRDLKREFGGLLKEVYVWHAFCGYWGGIRPNVEGMPESVVVEAKLSPGAEKCMTDLAVVKIVENGVGLVKPEEACKLYDELHSHLKSVGVDGVKIDVTHVLEMLSEDYGGRVELAKAYYKALTDSVRKHFKGNGVISSMQQCNDFMFLGTQTISLGRVDWDMFQSHHACSEFHAASRAISGGPIYVSDSVGNHNFKLLKKLVLPDGTILRCQHYALPTRDSLFVDPLHDGKTMLKIWNLNKYSGVLGLFNCQGGGWCPLTRRNKSASEFSHSVTCFASPKDIEWNKGKTPICIKDVDVFAVYMFKDENLKLLQSTESVQVSLEPFSFELMTVSPVTVLPKKSIQFAPIGLVNMLNSGGSILSLEFDGDENLVKIGVRGQGEMKVFASQKPISCLIDEVSVKFEYDDSMVVLHVPWPGSSKLSMVEYLF
ncbi:hypothetical protein TSUD_155940 [Trifolium subterraneum]|uniref:galactinol--sucrose galactosyltransferase n=1 Tax=Trifolium subterraneum TaxID=3900 RepID=A0A2Z6NW99_TRISU|nr:hypothetical protein TSUD_155940 [Trifolium subterraneum]